MNKKGYLYILTNASIPGKVKIGRTERNPEDRRKEISAATGVPTPFNLIHSAYFEDCHFAEKKLHERLFQEGKRTTKNKEFFDIDVDKAIFVVDEIAKELNSNNNNKENVKEIIGMGIKWLYGDSETLRNENRALEYFERAAFIGSPVGSYWAGICSENISNKTRRKEDKKHWQQRALNHYRNAMDKKYTKSFAKASWIYRKFDQKSEADNAWSDFLKLVNNSEKIDKDIAKWINKWIGQQIEWGHKNKISKQISIKKHKKTFIENLNKNNDPKGYVKKYLKGNFKKYSALLLFIFVIFLYFLYRTDYINI